MAYKNTVLKSLKKLRNATLCAMTLIIFCSFDNQKIDEALDQGFAAEDSGKYEQAIQIYDEILPEVPEDSLQIISDICSSLLMCHMRLGQLQLAMQYGERGLMIDEQLGDPSMISTSLSNLASVMLSAGRLEKAEEYLLRSVKIERDIQRNDKLAIRLGMLCELYLNKKQPDKALPLAQEALELDQQGGREAKAAIRMSQLGNALVCLRRTEEAMPYLTEALRLHQQYHNYASENITLVSLAMAHRDLGNTHQAIHYLETCIEQSQSLGQLNPQVRAYGELAALYHAVNDPRAYSCQLRHMELKDSVNAQEVQRQISDMEVKYDTYQKEQTIVQQEMLIQQQRLVYLGLAVMLVLALAVVFFLMRVIRLKNQNIWLRSNFLQILSHDLKNPAIAQQKSLHLLAHSLDKVDQATLSQMVNRMAEDADANVNLLYSLLDWARMQTGHLLFTPIEMDLVSVAKEVIVQHHEQAALKGIELQLECDEARHVIYADRQMVVSMVRNILSNAIKFTLPNAEPSARVVCLTVHGNTLVIEDEGIGYGTPGGEKGTGLGLDLVRKMADMNRTRFQIGKKSDRGTRVQLCFPTK